MQGYSLFAWNSEVHRKITQSAIRVSNVPDDLKNFLRKNSGTIENFSIKPDTASVSCAGHGAKQCGKKINEFLERILSGKREKFVAENMGRIAHYLADIHYPLLFQEPNEENRGMIHKCENEESQWIDLDSGTVPVFARHIENFEVEIDSAMRQSDFDNTLFFGSVFKSKAQEKTVSAVLKERAISSVQCTADFWYTVWRLKESEPVRILAHSSPTVENDIRLADIYEKQNRKNRVDDVFQKSYAKFGEDEKLILAEIKIYFNRKEFYRSAEICENKLKKNPSSTAFKYQLAVIDDHWFIEGGQQDFAVRDKAVSAWNSLLGSQFDGIARQRIEKLKETQK